MIAHNAQPVHACMRACRCTQVPANRCNALHGYIQALDALSCGPLRLAKLNAIDAPVQVITKLFPSQCNVYARGPVGENVLHIAMLLNTPSTLAIAKYLVKLYGKTLVNTPYQVWLRGLKLTVP